MITIFDVAAGAMIAELQIYTFERYRTEIFQAARLYWKEGVRGNFTTRMFGTIKFGLQAAFDQGASVVGVEPDDYEDADKQFIADIIAGEKSHVSGLLDFLDGLARSGIKNLSDADYRLEMWANRYPDVQGRAESHFGKRRRLQWVLGDAEHCETCLALSGIVAWAQEWEVSGIQPKSRKLACNGYHCACEFQETKRRRSPNALRRIFEIIG